MEEVKNKILARPVLFFLRQKSLWLAGLLFWSCNPGPAKLTTSLDKYVQVSGIYPHLAYYNQEGECGTGAVVPWAGKLWVVTYGPHFPQGSSDKLYAVSPELEVSVFEESIGGTPANRMIHRESNQLFIGPYAIAADGRVRVIPYSNMPGRHTGNARHLTDPAGKIYYGTMEEGFYEVDVQSLDVNMLYKDGNEGNRKVDADPTDVNPVNATLPGAHGKGLYSGQGVMVYSNNGEATREALQQFDVESGALAEWDGSAWRAARRNQFVEVTGPGGIYGNENPATDPLWATGWDHKSVLLGVRDADSGWSFFRLPKASHSYDGAHGWNTEWPRIRNIGTPEKPDYLMTMHGMFWRFPGTFSGKNTAGVRPRSAYLKVIGDFTRWDDRLVFGCDDSAKSEFLNKRKHKGGIEGPGQSNSNLWFTDFDKPDQLGPKTAGGAVWLREPVKSGQTSEPFLFAGWSGRTAWIQHDGNKAVDFSFEVDQSGNGTWTPLKDVSVPAGAAASIIFDAAAPGEWIRVRAGSETKVTLSFHYTGEDQRSNQPDGIFAGLQPAKAASALGGLLYSLGNNRRAMGLAVQRFDNGRQQNEGYYELNEKLQLKPVADTAMEAFIQNKLAIPQDAVSVEASSVLVTDDKGRRWRLPLGDQVYDPLTESGQLRICREVATERDLFSCHGTFYELPAENADGFAKIRPIASHDFRVHDYASYRGMLVMTGIDPGASAGGHIVRSEDGKAAVWVGVIDDLWKIGKPRGRGGPWKDSAVQANVPSDPYLIGFYDKKTLTISHDAATSVTFRLEVEPVGHGPWMLYKSVTVDPGTPFSYSFPEGFQARWIRFSADKNCTATAMLVYE